MWNEIVSSFARPRLAPTEATCHAAGAKAYRGGGEFASSNEIVSSGPRDDSGKVRRTLLRDERASRL